jgi:hypothetical protein
VNVVVGEGVIVGLGVMVGEGVIDAVEVSEGVTLVGETVTVWVGLGGSSVS